MLTFSVQKDGMLLSSDDSGETYKQIVNGVTSAVYWFSSSNKQLVLEHTQQETLLEPENMVTLYGVAMDEDDIGIVTEYMEGPCLADFLTTERAQSLETRTKISWCRQIVEAVGSLHWKERAHGNIRSDKIWLSADLKTVKIANIVLESAKAYLQTKESDNPVHPQTALEDAIAQDVYCLGIVMYQLFTLQTSDDLQIDAIPDATIADIVKQCTLNPPDQRPVCSKIFALLKKQEQPVQVDALDPEVMQGLNDCLLESAKKGDVDMCRDMLDNGANINYKEKKMSALLWSIFHGHDQVSQLLIERGADLRERDDLGKTPLHWAASYGRTFVVQLLLEKGAIVKSMDNKNNTPWGLAISCGFEEIAGMLASHSHTRLPRFRDTREPRLNQRLLEAAKQGDFESLKRLIHKSGNVNCKDEDDWTPLHFAAQRGHTTVCQLLIQSDAKIDQEDNKGRTALYLAVDYGHLDICRLLIRSGANLQYKTTHRWTFLHCAAWNGNMDVCRLLLEAKVNVKSRSRNGQTALHKAAEHGHTEICNLLIEHGADVNCQDHHRMTPLHFATEYASLAVCELLIKKGADPYCTDARKKTPLHIAVEEDAGDYRVTVQEEAFILYDKQQPPEIEGDVDCMREDQHQDQ
ncbi:ankyrin repeat-containing domain protein [Gorgonomyces haynaldii]|nr:ankyrin repeat-containing domain protein [Gorgonomyces haynaldii]